MATAFDPQADWHGEAKRDPNFDNQPPLEERLLMQFVEQLDREGITARITELTEACSRVPAIDSRDIAGRVGELIKQAGAARKKVEEIREGHNRPLLNAQRGLKARMDGLLSGMDTAIREIRQRLDAFISEENRKAQEAQRRADEAAREAAKAAAASDAPAPTIIPAEVERPLIHSDMGATVGTRTVWKHEVEVPIAKLPKAILENAKVVEAVNSVIAAMIRGGTREIKGVRIFSDVQSAVR
jgi:hypothetical protein